MNKNVEKKIKAIDTFLDLFLDDYGEKINWTETQRKIAYTIVLQKDYTDGKDRCGIICPTQYGKSTIASCAIILRTIIFKDKFTVIGGTERKTRIIGRYAIKHLFDNEVFTSQLDYRKSQLDRLKNEVNKERIDLKNGGCITFLTADYKNEKRIGETLLGEGSKNILLDDSVLCGDKLYAYVKRMLGGAKENFLVEIANPLKRNHFYKTMTDKKTFKIWIDYQTALKEGRFTEEYIDEMKKELFFDIFYACKFPDENDVDEKGYSPLLTEDEIKAAFSPVVIGKDKNNILGVDVARGGNNTVFVLRNKQNAKVLASIKTKNITDIAGKVIEYIMEYDIKPNNVCIDDTGIGGGVTDILTDKQIFVNGIKWANKSKSEKKYANLRAENYIALKKWVTDGGKIEQNENLFEQLKIIKYKTNSSGKIQIQPKEELLLNGYESPDEADALAFTFNENVPPQIDTRENKKVDDDDEFFASTNELLSGFTMKNFGL